MKVTATRLDDVALLQPRVFEDSRGFFMETWNQRVFDKLGLKATFVQDNFSRSARGTLRGLHYQMEQVQGKLVRVTQGEIFDVAVDMRQSSSTFGQWTGEVISADNLKQLWIPAGFAHGFLVLSENADVVYKCTDYYLPEAERTLSWDDDDLGIKWPLEKGVSPTLSEKDAQGLALKDAERYP